MRTFYTIFSVTASEFLVFAVVNLKPGFLGTFFMRVLYCIMACFCCGRVRVLDSRGGQVVGFHERRRVEAFST